MQPAVENKSECEQQELTERYGPVIAQFLMEEIEKADTGRISGFGKQRPFWFCQPKATESLK